MSSPGKPVTLIIGASRGMGRQIALTLAAAQHAVVLAAKSTAPDVPAGTPFPPDPDSPHSTAGTVAREITSQGGTAHAVSADARDPASMAAAVQATVSQYGRIDNVVYNAGAVWWGSIAKTDFKRYKLMREVNTDGLYAVIQAVLPEWESQRRRTGKGGRLVVVCPPIYSRFFRGKAAYASTKVASSVLVKGLGFDFEREAVAAAEASSSGDKVTAHFASAATGIWPATALRSGATREAIEKYPQELRTPDVFADAVLAMLRAPAASVNGLLTTDEDFLREHCGVRDFGKYSIVPGATPRRIMPAEFPTLRVAEQDDEGRRMDSADLRKGKARI